MRLFQIHSLLLSLLFSAGLAASEGPALNVGQIATGQFDYRTALVINDTGMEIEASRQIRREPGEAGRPLLVIETVTRTGMGDTVERLELDGETLRPLSLRIDQGDSLMIAEYGPDKVTGLIRAAGQVVPIDLSLDEPAYGGEAALEAVLTALPLSQGYRTRLRATEIDVDQLVRRFIVMVEDAETIEVPAGRFETWRLRLDALDDLGGSQRLWIKADTPRLLVRAEGYIPPEVGEGSLITELTAWTP